MDRKELKILGLSYSGTQEGSYILVLSQCDGMIKLPVIVKANDAQRIALEIEGIKNKRPQIHDLFKNMTDSFGIDIQEIYIHSVLEGIFYTKIISNNGLDDVELDSNIGDAIILSILYQCPIFASSEVMSSTGVLINDDGTPVTDKDVEESKSISKKSKVSIDDLEKMLEEAIRQEEFEIAATIRDRIDELKKVDK